MCFLLSSKPFYARLSQPLLSTPFDHAHQANLLRLNVLNCIA